MTLQCSNRRTPCNYFLYTNKRLATPGNALIRILLNVFYDTLTASIISLPQRIPGFILNHSSISSTSQTIVIRVKQILCKILTILTQIARLFFLFTERNAVCACSYWGSKRSLSGPWIRSPAISPKIPAFPRIHFVFESSRIRAKSAERK